MKPARRLALHFCGLVLEAALHDGKVPELTDPTTGRLILPRQVRAVEREVAKLAKRVWAANYGGTLKL